MSRLYIPKTRSILELKALCIFVSFANSVSLFNSVICVRSVRPLAFVKITKLNRTQRNSWDMKH